MKKLSVVALSVLLMSLKVSDIKAALLTFTPDGELYWNVLGTSDSSETTLEIKKIAGDYSLGKEESVGLFNENGKVFISLGADDKKVELDNSSEELIEIKELDAPQKLAISATSDGFAIKQQGVTAEALFPIIINSPQNKLSVQTDTGIRYLTLMPYDAVNLATSSNIISSVSGKISLIEEAGDVNYLVPGKKDISLFDFFNFEVPIVVRISAINGNVVDVDEPLWYSVAGFLLV